MAMLNNQRVYFIDCVVLSMHCSFRIFCMCFRQTDSETVLGACIYQGSNRPHRLAVILQIRYTNFTIMLQTITEAGLAKTLKAAHFKLLIHQSPGMPGKCLSRKALWIGICFAHFCQVPSGGSIRIIAPDDYYFGPVIETAATRPALSAEACEKLNAQMSWLGSISFIYLIVRIENFCRIVCWNSSQYEDTIHSSLNHLLRVLGRLRGCILAEHAAPINTILWRNVTNMNDEQGMGCVTLKVSHCTLSRW